MRHATMWRGLWAMAPKQLEQFTRELYAIDSTDPVAGSVWDSGASDVLYSVDAGKAYIPITGVIMKTVPAAVRWIGMPATSTLETSAAIDAASNDPEVSELVFVVDSPGGTVAGVQSLADQIRDTSKPTSAIVSDMAASAAYWLASQADTIEANATAQIGSIGVYSVLVDSSEAHTEAGIRVHVVRSGDHKGSGVPGSAITPEELAEEQRMIDQLAGMFTQSVAEGRSLTPEAVAQIATGQVWLAHDAQRLGLIDHIHGQEQAETEPEEVEEMADPEIQAQEPEEEEEETTEEEEEETTDQKVEALQTRVDDLEARVAELEGELETETAKANAAAVALKGIRVSRKTELIAAAVSGGKITPAMMASVETFAKSCGDNVDQLATFIEALPVQTREQAQTQTPAGDARGQVSASDARICEALGLSQESFLKNSKWDSIRIDGTPATKKKGLH